MRITILPLLILLSFNNGFSQTYCDGPYTLTQNDTIIVDDTSSFNTPYSQKAGLKTVIINKRVIIPAGVELVIKGSLNKRLRLKINPTLSFLVKPGGLLIIEYCDLEEGPSCEAISTNPPSAWNGITVEGNPNYEHYEYYHLTNGWDPYAEPFKPDGVYKIDPSGMNNAHGRLQVRFCTFKGVYADATTTDDDDEETIIREDLLGNYAIRSKEGGILNIIDCEFNDVRIGVYIDNYEKYSTDLPGSAFMNAFQIVDCDFNVSSTFRSSNDYKCCIAMYKAQKATIEGCSFNANGTELYSDGFETAIELDRSSLLMHKSGNFRRQQDFYDTETQKGCPKYGTEQNLSGFLPSHPWNADTVRKCEFYNFTRAINAKGSLSKDPLHTLAIDDALFENVLLPIKCYKYVDVSVSRSEFHFNDSTVNYSNLSATGLLGKGIGEYNVGDYDRADIELHGCKNTLITECDFESNFKGQTGFAGKNIYVSFYQISGGNFNSGIYDLVYKNNFVGVNHGNDLGVRISRYDQKAFVLMNCNTFTNLDCAIYIGKPATSLCDQFHYTDMDSLRSAPARNVFTNNTCDIDAAVYNGTTCTYWVHTSETHPQDCHGSIISVSSNMEDSDCSSITCQSFPMSLNTNDNVGLKFQLFPNPSSGRLNIQFNENVTNPRIVIYDITGRIVFEDQREGDLKSTNFKIELKDGTYYLKVETDNVFYSNGIILIRN